MAVKDINGFRHTQNASIALYYGGELSRASATLGSSGTFYASPYIGPGGLLSNALVGIYAPAATHFARLALYSTDSTANLYPSTLLVDVGCITGAVATSCTVALPFTLDADRLYWRVLWVSGNGAWQQAGASTKRMTVFGYDANMGTAPVNITVPYTGDILAGFPATFPHSGRALQGLPTANVPTFFLSYSGAT
jgi:hypothetical protein